MTLGVAGPVATPSTAACLPLQLIQVHNLQRVSVIFRQDRLQGMPRDRVDTSTTRSLPFTTKVSTDTVTVSDTDSSQVYFHTNLVEL